MMRGVGEVIAHARHERVRRLGVRHVGEVVMNRLRWMTSSTLWTRAGMG
jgi:hypothetical protein